MQGHRIASLGDMPVQGLGISGESGQVNYADPSGQGGDGHRARKCGGDVTGTETAIAVHDKRGGGELPAGGPLNVRNRATKCKQTARYGVRIV